MKLYETHQLLVCAYSVYLLRGNINAIQINTADLLIAVKGVGLGVNN
jgi:hypothetical protein